MALPGAGVTYSSVQFGGTVNVLLDFLLLDQVTGVTGNQEDREADQEDADDPDLFAHSLPLVVS
jgi:hypothetical protein